MAKIAKDLTIICVNFLAAAVLLLQERKLWSKQINKENYWNCLVARGITKTYNVLNSNKIKIVDTKHET